MSQRSTPRFFAGRPDSSREELPAEIDPTQVVDNFFIGGRTVMEREWAITIDPFGRLQGWSVSTSNVLSQELQSQLAYNDVACASGVRCLEAQNFYLFHMTLLEQPADAPGLNDPVYLYGTLYGPYPEAGNVPSAGIEGQLTVTRADLLDGIVHGARFGFRSAPDGGAGPAARTFNVLLPGDRDEEIASGRGLIMMYPLNPPEMVHLGIQNELIIAQLLYDVLSALKDDVVKNKVNNPLRSIVLPVPNRFMMEQNLIDQGYTIKGDVAVRSKISKVTNSVPEQFTGLLASVFGERTLDKLELPPEGTVDDLIAIAEDCIYKLPGWPPPRTVATRNRCQAATPDIRARAATSAPMRAPIVHTPKATEPAAVSTPIVTAPRMVSTPQSEWMQDFIQSHRKEGAPPPRITSSAPVSSPSPTPAPSSKKKNEPQPDWLKDFE